LNGKWRGQREKGHSSTADNRWYNEHNRKKKGRRGKHKGEKLRGGERLRKKGEEEIAGVNRNGGKNRKGRTKGLGGEGYQEKKNYQKT